MAERKFRYKTFASASESEITQVERQGGGTFCDDFRAFLRAENGLSLEDLDLEVEGGRLYQMRCLLGLAEVAKYAVDEKAGFFHPRFFPICYPVGEDGGGNLMVQIAAGVRRGQIAMLDHEVFFCGMDALLEVEDGLYPDDNADAKKLPFDSFAEATPDQIVDECSKQGFLSLCDVTFGEFLEDWVERLNVAAEAAASRPKPAPVCKIRMGGLLVCMRAQSGEWLPVQEMSRFLDDFYLLDDSHAIAAQFFVECDEQAEVTVLVRVTSAGEPDLETRMPVPVGSDQTFVLELARLKTWTDVKDFCFELSIPDDARFEKTSSQTKIVAQKAAFPFTFGHNYLTAEKEIASFEEKLGYRFCDDFRQWCDSLNGIRLIWPSLHLWKALPKSRYDKFDAEFQARRSAAWELEVTDIYGLSEPYDLDLADAIKREANRPVFRVMYPVAKTPYSGRYGFYQIAAGAKRGRIVELLESRILLDAVERVKDGHLVIGTGRKAKHFEFPFATYAEATPDLLLDAWSAHGQIRLTDMSFAQFSHRVIEAHGAEYRRMFEKYVGDIVEWPGGANP